MFTLDGEVDMKMIGIEHKPDNGVGPPLDSGGAVLVILNDNVILPFTGSGKASRVRWFFVIETIFEHQ